MSKVALVTGGTRGIGFAIAKQLLNGQRGVCTVVVTGTTEASVETAADQLRTQIPVGARVVPIALDLADRGAIAPAVEQILNECGGVDVLVNNAGITRPAALQQIDMADFEQTMAVNLYGPFLLVQELLQHGNQFEAVINIASTAGMSGRAGWLTYSASKAALISMSEVMRSELGIYGTKVFTVSPGRTATDLRKMLAPTEDPATIMQPDAVAGVIEALLGDAGAHMESTNIVVR